MRVSKFTPATAPVSPRQEKNTPRSMGGVTAVDNAPVRLSDTKQSVGKDDLNKLGDGIKKLGGPDEYQRPPPSNPRREAPFDNSVKTAPNQRQTQQTATTSADPVSMLANFLTYNGAKLTSTDDAQEMINKFASHVQATLADNEHLYQKTLYLTHITRLLDIIGPRLSKLPSDPATKGKHSALQAVLTYQSEVANDLKNLEVLLEKEEGHEAYQRPSPRNPRREARW